jgi:protocatechuate 3,4-dioxygenase, alpha subunit
MSARCTPSQTVGPFFSIGFDWLKRNNLTEELQGDRVVIRGRILDGDGKLVPDAVLEIWHPDATGQFAPSPNSAPMGFARVPTDENGVFSFTTVKPGALPASDGRPQAPHLQISIFMRGLLQRLSTRLYFPDEPLNASDDALALVPEARHATLIARRAEGSDGILDWDVHLQGEQETVFFEL